MSTDHSPIFFSFSKIPETPRGNCLWKFNNSLCSNIVFILENKLKQLEANANFQFDDHYLECKNNLEQIYQEKANGVKIRSKCDWYEFGEKSSMHCKTRFELSFVTKKKLRIKTKLHHFYKTLFTEKLQMQMKI